MCALESVLPSSTSNSSQSVKVCARSSMASPRNCSSSKKMSASEARDRLRLYRRSAGIGHIARTRARKLRTPTRGSHSGPHPAGGAGAERRRRRRSQSLRRAPSYPRCSCRADSQRRELRPRTCSSQFSECRSSSSWWATVRFASLDEKWNVRRCRSDRPRRDGEGLPRRESPRRACGHRHFRPLQKLGDHPAPPRRACTKHQLAKLLVDPLP